MVRRLRDVDALKRVLLSPAQAMMLQFVRAREDAETDCSKLVSEKSFKKKLTPMKKIEMF